MMVCPGERCCLGKTIWIAGEVSSRAPVPNPQSRRFVELQSTKCSDLKALQSGGDGQVQYPLLISVGSGSFYLCLLTTMSILRGLRSYGTKLAGKAYPPSETPLVLSPKQLQDLVLTGEPVKVLDASWFMPNSPRKGLPEFLSKRIPGAQFLDLDEVASPHDLGLKHMMPTERVFADACGESIGRV